jgi:hypothetical protein
MSVELAAQVWGKFVQPLAAKYNLKLVSPTFNVSTKNLAWSAGFLKACVDLADDSEYPCDYRSISAISIHDYRCDTHSVNQRYKPKTGKFFTNMEESLNGYGGIDW